MPLTLDEVHTDDNAVITRVSRWFDMIDEIRATNPRPEEK